MRLVSVGSFVSLPLFLLDNYFERPMLSGSHDLVR